MVIWYIKLQNSLRKRKNLYSNNKYRKLYHYIFGYLLNLLATVGAHVHKFFPIKYSTFGVNYRSTFTLLFKYSVACKDKGALRRTNKGTTFTQQYTMLFSLSFSLCVCVSFPHCLTLSIALAHCLYVYAHSRDEWLFPEAFATTLSFRQSKNMDFIHNIWHYWSDFRKALVINDTSTRTHLQSICCYFCCCFTHRKSFVPETSNCIYI